MGKLYLVYLYVERDVILLFSTRDKWERWTAITAQLTHTLLFVSFRTGHGNCRFTPSLSHGGKQNGDCCRGKISFGISCLYLRCTYSCFSVCVKRRSFTSLSGGKETGVLSRALVGTIAIQYLFTCVAYSTKFYQIYSIVNNYSLQYTIAWSASYIIMYTRWLSEYTWYNSNT